MPTLTARVAVITGSSRGIGAAIATLFAAEGAQVVIHGRDHTALEKVRAQIADAGGDVLAITADLTRLEEIEALRLATEEGFGPADVLVANGGGSPVPPGPVEDITEADWRASVDANLTASFLTIKTFLPAMKRLGRGNIITLSSAAARRPTAHSPVAYTASKAGIELLTQAVALQAGPDGIRANCLAPETIMTERNEQQIPAAIRDNLIAAHPVRRLGTPDDVAQAALFLAAENSSWISGVTLDVAGGSVLA
jgi:3-oxoacyl-[acyl-carrier protein] reductase